MKYGLLPARFLTAFFASSLCLTSAFAEQEPDQETKKEGRKPLVQVKQTSAYKNSHIIVDRGEHTIVPVRSILILPEKLKSHVVEKPTGKLILWPNFKRNHQNLIWTYEVTLDQVKGITPIHEGTLKDLAKLNRVVIALFRGHPISVVKPQKKGEGKDAVKQGK